MNLGYNDWLELALFLLCKSYVNFSSYLVEADSVVAYV